MNLDDIKKKHQKNPLSCWSGAVVGLIGLAVTVAYLAQLFQGETLLPWNIFLVLGPGLITAGGVLWSKWGAFVDATLQGFKAWLREKTGT